MIHNLALNDTELNMVIEALHEAKINQLRRAIKYAGKEHTAENIEWWKYHESYADDLERLINLIRVN